MIHRMYEYRGYLRRLHDDLEIYQYVVFLGNNPPTMRAELHERNLFFRYDLLWFGDLDYHLLLAFDQPELIPLAFLADFGTAPPELVAEQVIERLHETARSELDLQRFINQLRMLANMRSFTPLIDSIMEKISRFFVPERDPWFNDGVAKGKLEGKIEGMTEAKFEVVVNLILESDHEDAFIARIVGLEPDTVKAIRHCIRQHPNDFREKLQHVQMLPE